MIGPVGVVGLGSIGEPIAENALAAGFRTAVFDLRREPLDRLARRGARIASSLHDLASSCSAIQVVVGHDAQLESVVLGGGGSGGLVAGMAPGTTVLVHSTVHPDTMKRVLGALEERGFAGLDAPVSGEHGAEAAARTREVTFMIGGRAGVLDAVRPLLEASGRRIHHLGDVGAGTLAKLAANAMTLVAMESTREALRLARRAGIDVGVALEVWRHSSGNSWAVENWERMHELAGRHPGGRRGLSDLGAKDLGHALDVARRLEAPLPLAALVSQLMEPRFGEEWEAESAKLREPGP